MRPREGKRTVWANIAVIAVTLAVWAALASPCSVTAMAGGSLGAVYSARSKTGISIQCVVTGDSKEVERIAGILSENGVCATFAVSGEWARAHPGLLRRLYGAGNGVAVLASFKTEEDADAIEAVTGERPRLCVLAGYDGRLPAGFVCAACTFDLDTGRGGAEDIVKRLEGRVTAGAIVNASATRAFADALPAIIEKIKNMGLDIVPTHKMLYNYSGAV